MLYLQLIVFELEVDNTILAISAIPDKVSNIEKMKHKTLLIKVAQ